MGAGWEVEDWRWAEEGWVGAGWVGMVGMMAAAPGVVEMVGWEGAEVKEIICR
jgi:hypothetical protein